MLFNTIDYLIFFIVVFGVNYILPKGIRYIWLLAASYYFYMQWNPWYSLLILGTTIITYVSGFLISRNTNKNRKRIFNNSVLIFCLVILLGVLGYFKYYDLFLGYVNKVISHLGFADITRRFEVLLPVGISFYILQSLGYVIDVYRGEIEPQKNILRYALFVSFFPQLVAGPIERSSNLMGQLQQPKKLTWDGFRSGLLLILYGLFCKVVIADRIAVIVKTVYGNPNDYPGFYILYAAALFSFQIYCDFYGYSTIARGSAKLLGISLVDNFNAPYFSKSIKEFWRRWHISLSSWFRDYLYIPLGGNRKGFIRKNINLLFVFGVSGLWHGASLSFVLWGLLNGFYQVVSDVFKRIKNKLTEFATAKLGISIAPKVVNFSKELLRTFVTFTLISFTWIFFAADSLIHSAWIIKRIIRFNWNVLLDESLYSLGVDRHYTGIMFLGIIILMIVDYLKYKNKNVVELVLAQDWWFRAVIYVGLIMACMIFGCYGEMYDTQQFIYFQF